MALPRIALLFTVGLTTIQTVCAFHGEIKNILDTSEQYPWGVLDKDGMQTWNKANVDLLGMWVNESSSYKLICAKIRTSESYRAILYKDSQTKRTMNVLSCKVNLLNSVIVVPGFFGFDMIYFLLSNGECKMNNLKTTVFSYNEISDHEPCFWKWCTLFMKGWLGAFYWKAVHEETIEEFLPKDVLLN